MDFIERWLHISPDGGSGALEAFYFVTLIGIVGVLVFRKQAFRVAARILVAARPGHK